jgi:Flp pilus assembly protein TadG
LRKLFTQPAQPTRLYGAKPRWHGVIDDSGAQLVEFAISASLLIALLIGIIYTCFALYAGHFVSEAALAGARWAMVRGSASCTNTPNLTDCNATAAQIQTYVEGLSYPGINSSSLTVTPTWCSVSGSTPATWTSCSSSTSNAPGNAVQVVVSYPFPLPIPSVTLKSLTDVTHTFTFSSTSQLVISQ